MVKSVVGGKVYVSDDSEVGRHIQGLMMRGTIGRKEQKKQKKRRLLLVNVKW